MALDELHSYIVPTAHLDVRLPNIVFGRSDTGMNVKLIDLDRYAPADGEATGTTCTYTTSDMYIPGNSSWVNRQLDWKAVGLIVCYVLDDGVQKDDYYCMLCRNKVNVSLKNNKFVKCLLDGGKLLYHPYNVNV